jgi:hypothetical protein
MMMMMAFSILILSSIAIQPSLSLSLSVPGCSWGQTSHRLTILSSADDKKETHKKLGDGA